MLSKALILFAAALGVAAQPVDVPSRPIGRPGVSNVVLYGYGPGIGGFPVIRIKDTAYLAGNISVPENTDTTDQAVTFTGINESRTLKASTASQNSTEASSLFAINKDSNLAVYTTAEDTSAVTTGFFFFGSMLFVDMAKPMQAVWTAQPAVVDGQSLWQLGWNSTADNAVRIALKATAPMH